MTKFLALLVVAALLPASIPGPSLAQGPARRAVVEEPLPIPPIPPELPTQLDAAPTPNSVSAPVVAQAPRGAELMPTLMGPKQYYQGEGFLAGSTVQGEQQRKAKPAAGFNLTVPLR